MDASRDQNFVPTIIAVSEDDGTTLVPIEANVSNDNALMCDDGTTGTDFGPANAAHDQNFVHSLVAVSETDGVTPVVLYATADGMLLIDSN